ncbi:Allantoicase [Myotisia sp. PD_48]|nr:Allantoicase [Myotisia sp. PD_48]
MTAPTPIPADLIDETFSRTTNLASSGLNSQIISCSDEYFAAASNLLTPTPPVHKPGVFVHTGAWYDGWETRRHNSSEYDWAIIKLGVGSGIVEGVEIDTAYFVGNYGESVLVEGAFCPTSPEADQILQQTFSRWETFLPLQPCGPSMRQAWKLSEPTTPLTHVRVRMYPDGGFARIRLYGHALPPSLPASDDIPVEELSSALMGGLVLSASNQHYTPASNLLLPGRGLNMGDGWETARSRVEGHVDWVIVKLGLPGSVVKVVVDTKDFRGNFPRAVRVDCISWQKWQNSYNDGPLFDHPGWSELVKGEKRCKADTEHLFEGENDLNPTDEGGITHVKLTVIPDGGVKRFRVFGKRDTSSIS